MLAHGVGNPVRAWEGLTAQFVPLADGARALGLRPGQLADAARRSGLPLVFLGSGGQRTRAFHLRDFKQLAAALDAGHLGRLHVRRQPAVQQTDSHTCETSKTEETVLQETTMNQSAHVECAEAPYVVIETTAPAITVTDDAPVKISLAEAPVSADTNLLAKLEGELEIMRQAYQEQIASLHASQNQVLSLGRASVELRTAAEEAHDERAQFERELVLARGRIEELVQRCAQLAVDRQKARAACSPGVSTSALRVVEEQRDSAAAALSQERQGCLKAFEELQQVRTEGTRLARELMIVQDGYKSQLAQLEASHDISAHSERALRDLRVSSKQDADDLNRVLANERSRAAALERSLLEREDEMQRLAGKLELAETICQRQAEELTTDSARSKETREHLSRMSARAQAAMTRVSGLQHELANSRCEADKLASRLRVEEVKRTVLTRRLGEAAARLRELHALQGTFRRPA